MSRPRSSDPAKPLTFSMPGSLHTRLNNHISFEMSRSAWISAAIKSKLIGESNAMSLSNYPTRELIASLSSREEIDDTMKALLIGMLNA